ncbi:TPA: D-tyrosyl-tRNA(Tyr) deacylase [Candidatus Dependentiae bacterium]|nr:MAG: D-tyrosyl-tRNA(Tyr) deacylase [candidate division TM6 bacterium GW2011_GWF2_36_131]KKQ03263.1 MAG: D-tyrosyl-tRNA(Tyr) deacylase [candidate division TM6 bacterium GW2011_GWE2_36_25]KKQ19185.1 MAG: D-tyrosyl-tRNA(Tyr) deacylase [candidate division TM6 bacterium GW2011_GWA2_36_9]HBR70309.1 D-tyrosyl-tRNA(Tyr) deacylase [Candidatus Dependentiae bacterium]HCU00854.1 D-tyrosyl-tRNA(Tyr) deacylase [Candidatus Dependentiae bacterium]
MRLVIQRVLEASVKVDDDIVGAISRGLLILVGFHKDDKKEAIDYLVKKLVSLRIFSDEEHRMNKNVGDINGNILLVPQFTLYANCTKGNRPSFDAAMVPEIAHQFFNEFVDRLALAYSQKIQTGIFGAHMKVSLVNDGPVTVIIDA